MSASDQVSVSAVDRENPWPGLASFTEDLRGYFFGREKETEELVRLIRRNTLTVLFGQSGLGKSSLLQAGAFPLLREADFLPLYLRLDHGFEVARAFQPVSGDHGSDVVRAFQPVSSEPTGWKARATLADQVKAALVDAFKAAGADAPAPRADETLWEYFHRKDIDIWSAKNRLLTPVLAFDQFEEIFTLGRASDEQRERGRAFLAELADLVENRAPAALREKFDSGELDITRYNFDKPSCQVVLSLREDFLPDLEGLKDEMRSIMLSRMRVRRLNGTQALEIVTKPAPHLLAEGVAERVVEFVAGARGGSAERLTEMEVEPALLSVICRELNERRRALGQEKITADLVSGNRREILTNFYERSVADLPADMRTFVEDHLLTKSGFRDNLALETALEFPGVTRPLLDTLVSRRLLRIEDRLGVQRVELTHDVLAEVIRASRDARQQRLALEQARERERRTRRRMWFARTIAAGLLVGLTGVSWVAWRAIRAEREQGRLRQQAQTHELAARQKAYASDLNLVQQALAVDNLGRAQGLLDRQRPQPGQRDLRGWEWRYLWQFCQSDAQSVICQKPDSINTVAVSRDGKFLAVGEDTKGGLSVWNLQTSPPQEMRVPAGDGRVRAVFSPREPLLAIATATGATLAKPEYGILLWNIATKQLVRRLQLGSSCAGLVFSEDGQTLITATTIPEYQITLWRVSDGKKLAGRAAPFRGYGRWNIFALNLEYNVAAHAAPDSAVRVMDLATGQERWSAKATDESVQAVAISPDGKLLATGAGFTDGVIRLWEMNSGREIGRLEGHRGSVLALVFWPDGKTLASAGGDQTIRLWDVNDRRLLRTLRGHKLEVWSLALLPDSRTLVSGSKDGSVFLWDTMKTRASGAYVTLPKPVFGWRFAEDSKSVLTVDSEGKIERWHGEALQETEAVMEIGKIEHWWKVQFAPDYPLVAVGTDKGMVKVWDWERRVLLRELKATDRRAYPTHFLGRGGKLLVVYGTETSGDDSLHEWDLATGQETRSWRGPPNSNGFESGVSPDERWCLVFGYRGTDLLIDLATGKVTSPRLNLRNPDPFSFSPDGKLIAAPSNSGFARIWDATTFREVATLSGFMLGVHSATFSPDGRRLATGSNGFEAVKLWDVESHEALITLAGRGSNISRTAFSPDGSTLGARGAGAGQLVLNLWRAPSREEIEKAEAKR